MIIDTTCSVIERKMKEVAEKSKLTFSVDDFVFNLDGIDITITTSSSSEVSFYTNYWENSWAPYWENSWAPYWENSWAPPWENLPHLSIFYS